jgi:23S rRNA pseudouridine2605 synthase
MFIKDFVMLYQFAKKMLFCQSILMRINQYLAYNINISRRKADEYISKGKVLINGVKAQLGEQVKDGDVLEYFDIKANKIKLEVNLLKDKNQSILFYKPIFCLTSKFDPEKRKTIYDFLPKTFHHLKPAGRLDYMSEGLLVLSNDGDQINELTHPKFNKNKVYFVAVKLPLAEKDLKQFAQGFVIDDYTLNPVLVSRLKDDDLINYSYLNLQPDLFWYSFELSEGRNNQIRKMILVKGQKVQRLIRVKQGNYSMSKELKIKKILPI